MSHERTVTIEHVLEEELGRLKRRFDMGYDLKVVWVPDGNGRLCGEVKEETVFIYEKDLSKALKTLKHEFLDYTVTQVIEPYKEVTNIFIRLLNRKACKQKEALVEKLSELF